MDDKIKFGWKKIECMNGVHYNRDNLFIPEKEFLNLINQIQKQQNEIIVARLIKLLNVPYFNMLRMEIAKLRDELKENE